MKSVDERSQLKEKIKKLENENAQLKAFYEYAPLPYQSLDKNGCFIDINPSWLATLGYEKGEVKGEYFGNFLHNDWKHKFDKKFSEFKRRGYVHSEEFRMRHKKGYYIDVLFEGSADYESDGSLRQTYCVFNDITEIKKTKETYQELFNKVADAITIHDPKTGEIVDVNNTGCKLWGYSKEELIGSSIEEIAHTTPSFNGEKARSLIRKAYKGEPQTFEWKDVKKDGTIFWAEVNLNYAKIKGEERVIAAVREITERKETEKELKRKQDLLEKSQEIAHVGSWELDLTENRLTWSDEVYRIFGLNPREFEATYEAFLEMVHPDDRKAVSDAYEGSIIEGDDHYEIEHRIVRKKDRQIKYVYERCEHLKDNSGKVVKSIGIVRDISEQRQSEENFRKLFENAPIGVFRTDSKGKPLMANSTMANILGFDTPDEVIDYYDDLSEQLYVDPQRRREFLQIMKDQGWVENFEYEAKRKDGKHIWLSMTAKFSNEKDDNDFVIDGFTSDITGRKETDKQLEKRENFISALLNNLNVGVVACDAEGILTYFNEKTREFHGVPLENIPPEEWANYYELYTMDGKTRMDTKDIPLYRALRGEYFNEIEMVIKSRRGSSLSVLNSGQPLKDTQGNITGAVVAMHDITERKQSEYQLQKKYEEIETTEEELRVSIEELQDANQKLEEQKDELEIYKKMVESSEDMMAVVDVDYKYICVNNAYLKYYHLKQEEVKGYRARDVIGDMYFEERVKSNLDKCLKGETVQYEMVRKFPEFGDVHLDIIYYPLEIGKGVEGVVSAIRDITERKKYEKELYNAKKRAEENEALTKKNLYNIEFLASSAVNFVEKKYEKDIYNFIAGKFRELNPEASIVIINEIDHDNSVIETKAFKGSDASIGKLINDLGIQIIGQQYSFDERIEGLSDGKIKKIDGGIHELSFESIPKDVAGKIENELKIERMYGIAFILNNKIYADAFLLFPKGRDIQNTDTLETFVRQASLALKRRDSEQELIKAKEKAEESDRLKSAFLANMSHEIRTPMNGILGFSQILMEGDFTKEKQNKFLGIIHSRTKHLLKIITDIVDIAKIESDQLSINKEKFYLNDIIKELYDFYQKDIKEKAKKDIKLKIKLSLERERSYIKSDITRIRQILDNLVSNAIKFTDEGEVEIGYNYSSKGGLLFWVKDTGIGISIEDQEKIFERFRQADESNNRLYEGTGLGLTLSKNLVELLGGKIWVDSAKGEGSVFYFTLPCERAYKGDANEDKKEIEDLNWHGKAILVVEDDPTSLEYIKEIIAPTGAEIILKETGEAGYQAFKENTSVDLILMDVRLPDISGLEIIKRIRQTDKNVKIIAQTAHAMGEDRNSCLQAGADNYIAKPIKMDNLLKIIKQHV